MSLKLLLADDDVEMLEAMAGMLSQHSAQYEIVGMAEDGAQALAQLRRAQPDILITDISMPRMDGLELIQQAKLLNPNLATVLVTCHEEFHYAREAIQLMVDEYLVKYTLTEKELLHCLSRLQERLNQRRTHQNAYIQLSGEVYKNKEKFKESYIQAMVQGQSQRVSELQQKAPMYEVTLPAGKQELVGIFVDNFEQALTGSILDDADLLRFALMNLIIDIFSDCDAFIFSYEQRLYLMLSSANKPLSLTERLSQLAQHAEAILQICPTAVILSKPFEVETIGKAIAAVQQARAGYFYQPNSRVVQTDKDGEVFAPPCRHDDWLEDFRQNIFQPERLKEIFAGVQQALLVTKYAPDHLCNLLEGFNIALDAAMRSRGGKLPKVVVDGETYFSCVRQVQDNIRYFAAHMAQNGQITQSQDIRAVVQYVSDHLADDISLEKVASVIYKNPSYLSRLFKREIGLTFSEYLTKQRIEKALWLLTETSMNVEAIGESIGIASVQYFYKFFKRETGKKPGDLRKNRR